MKIKTLNLSLLLILIIFFNQCKDPKEDDQTETWDLAVFNGRTPLSIEIDTDKEVWIGTNNGLIKFDDGKLTNVPLTAVGDSVIDIVSSLSGVNWFGTEAGVAATLDGQTLSVSGFNRVYEVLFNRYKVTSMDVSSTDTLYFGTNGGGIGRYVKGVDGITGASLYDQPWGGIVSMNITAVYVDEMGKQWFGTDMGVSFHPEIDLKGDWSIFTTADGLPANAINSITGDANNNIYFATNEGLSIYDADSTFNNYTMADGLPSNTLNCVEMQADILWIGTDSGLVKYDGSSFTIYTSEEGLPDNNIMDIATNDNKTIWVISDSGVTKFIP